MPDFDKNLNPILVNEDSNPMNLPNPASSIPVKYASLSNTNLSPKGGNAFDDFFGSGPVISPMLPTVSAKELYDNRRYGKYEAGVAGIEDQHGYAQSNWDKATNGILKGLNLTATTIAGGFTTLYGIGKWATTGRFADVWDNEGSRSLDKWNNEVDQTYLPNYYTDKEKNASWYSTDNWLTANFLFDKLIKNSGYAVGAMVGGNIANAGLLKAGAQLGKLAAKGASLAEASQAFKLFTPILRNTARAFSSGKNIEAAAILEKELSSIADISTRASKLGELAMQTNKFAEMGDATRRTLISIYSSAGESSFEALSTANQYRESLIEQYKDTHAGELPSGADLEKINQESEKVGKISFLGNMALLAATEFTQLPKLLGSSYSSSKQAANSLLGRADDVLLKDGKYVAEPTVTTRFGKLYEKAEGISKKVTGVGKYIFDPKEAAQEIGQYALQVGTQNYFNKAYQTNNADVWVDGFLYGLVGKNEKGEDVGALVSKEGIESGILGGITGGLMQAKGTYLEQKARKSNTQSFVDSLNNAPSFKKAFIERKDAVNRGVILNQQEQDAVMNGDKLEANDLNFDSMHNYLAPRVKYGRYDMVKEDIKELRQELAKPNGIDSLKEQGVANIDDNGETFLEKLNNFEKTTDYVNSLYKSLNLRYSGVMTEDDKRKYSSEVIDKMVYAASKIADYDMRIPMENASLVEAGINTLPILESIINEFSPNKIATQEAINQINGMTGIISEKRDELKSALTNVIELSMRRKLFMDEFDQIKNKPEEFETPSEFKFGETEELPVSVKQREIPEGKKRKRIGDKEIEIGKVYSLKQPMFKKPGGLVFDPKIAVLSQTLGGELEVQMPDGSITFMRPDEFLPYDISETSYVTPRLQEILDNAIDNVLNRKKYADLKKPQENKLDYINSLKNIELVNDVEKEFGKQSKQYLKDLAEEIARAEKLAKYKDQLQRTQEDIQKLSSDIPTRDDESDLAIVDSWEDMLKAARRLFTSTTHISEDFEKGNIPAHTTRFIEFTNNVKNLRKKFDIKVMLVTSAQENLLGLDGLSAMSFGDSIDKSLIVTKEQFDALSDEKKKEVILNGFVGAVAIKVDKKGNKTFIDKDGNSIGVVGEVDPSTGAPKKIDLGKVIVSTMPGVNLYNSKNNPKYRKKEETEAIKYVAAWQEYRKRLFEGNPKNFFDFDFGVSKGLPNINSASPEKNFVGDVLLDDTKRINTEQFIIVSTKGEIAHEDGNNYKFAAGRPAFKNADDLVYLNNNKFSKKRAAAIFAVLKKISEGVNEQASNGSQIDIKRDELINFIINTLFWYSKGGPSANKIYIDENNLLHIGKKEGDKIVESTYNFANIASFEREIINDLVNSYHNVNNKTLSLGLAKPFTEFYLDDTNTLQKRVWSNYQSFLISGENPDGSKRTIDEAPLYTRISKPTAAVPYALKQKYLFLLGMELPVTLPKKEEKDVKSNTTEYNLDGKTVNKYTSKEIVDFGDYFEFTASASPEGKVTLETAETEHNSNVIEKINKNPSLKKQIREVLKKYIPEATLEQFGDDIEFVEIAVPTIIKIDIINLLKKEKEGTPSSSSTSTPTATETAATFTPTTPYGTPTGEPITTAVTETPPPVDLSGLDDEDSPFRKVGIVGKEVERMTEAEKAYFEEFVNKNLPGIPYEYIENLVRVNGTDEEAWGVFENGVAKVYKRAAKGTAFHEIMEGVWLGFLSPEQQKALLDEMRSKKGSFLDRASGQRIDHNAATDLQLKERIMDDAAEYFAGKIPAKSITGKILQFFKSIVEFFKHWIGNPSLKEQLFRDIAKGKYKTFVFPEEKKKAAPQYKAIETETGYLPEQIANDYVQDIAARVYQKIIENNESLFDVVTSIKKLDIFGNIKEQYRKAGVFNSISEETYAQLVDRTKDFLGKFNIAFDENDVMSFNDETRTKDGYAADTFSVNFKKSSPYAVKLFLSSLIRAERSSGPIGTLLNMPKLDRSTSSIKGFRLVPYGETFSTLMNKLSNVRDVPTFINKLYELAKENPDYVRLYTRLGGDMSSPTPKINFDKFKDHNWRLFVSFYQVFTKQKPEGFIQFLEDGQVYTGSANQASLIKQIADEWKENLKLLSEAADEIVKYDASAGIYKVDKDSEKWKSVNTSSPQGMVDFLSKIGIEFPLSAYNKIKSSDLKKFADAVSGIKTALNKSDALMTVKSKEFDMKGNVEALSRLYVSVTNPVEDSTFFNNMGKRQQAFTESNYPSLFESIINTVESITELKEKMPQLNDVFSSNSVLLKEGGPLFDEDGFRRKNTDIKVQYILGNKNTDANKGESISQLTIGERTTLEINQNIRGSYYVIIPGDGSTEWMMNLGNSIEFSEVQSGEAFEKINDIFYGYLRDEINLIIDASNRKNANVIKKASQLRFMRGILSDSLIEEIEELAQKPNVSNDDIDSFIANEENKKRIEQSFKDFIETTVEQQKKVLEDNREVLSVGGEGRLVYRGLDKSLASYGINKYNLNKESLNKILTFVNMNYIINQIEYHKILFGDPYQFKIKQEGSKVVIDQTKRIKPFLSPRRITVNFGVLNNWLNDDLNTVDGITLTKNDFGYHQHKDYAKTFTAKDVKIVGKLSERFPPYAKTDEADASSWMNPGAYREVKWKNGQWSPEAEAFHQWQMAYARNSLARKGKYSYPKDNRLRKHDEKLLEDSCPKYYIDVLKPIGSGNKFGKNQIDLVIDKTSQLPIYYQAVEGTNLEELFITMFKNGYDYVIVESGRKVGVENSHSLYNGSGEFNTDEINNTIEVPWDAYGIQVENSYGKEKLQTRGSQLTKISTADLYSEGEAIGSTPERKEAVKSAVERNTIALRQLVNNGYQNFLKKLGIDDLGTVFLAPDKKKIAKVLKEELLRTDTSYNTLDTLAINPSTGEFEIDFESSVNYKRIKDVLYSIIDKFIGSPKMNGFPAVQVASTMWENSKEGRELVERIENEDGTFSYKKISRAEYNNLSDDKKKDIRFTSSALKFYEDEDGKRYCEVMIPNWFRKKLGKDLTKEEFTKLINSDEGKKLLTGVGFRIPTQALNSVEVFVVKGFLPDFMGRTVVVPSEITTKAGSDFDIDKLNLYLKNVYVTPTGEIVEVPFFGYGEEAKAKMKDFIFAEEIKAMLNIDEDFVGDREDDYDTLTDRLYNESLENEYYNSLIEVLTLPENFERLVVPNSSKELEEIAEDLSNLRNEKDNPNAMRTLLNRSEMTNLRQVFVTAKNWVGRAATNITAHSLFQKTTMYVKPANYKMSLPHNTVTIGNEDHVSFSGIFDRAGKYISDTLSMFANSFVDVVKDPYIMKILYSDRLVSTYMMLTRAGVPIKTLSYFMNQPIIREYIMQLDAQGVSPFNIKNKSILAPILSKYPATENELKNGVILADDASLKNNIIAHTEGSLTKQQKLQQRLILEEFFSHFELASQLFEMTMALNYDTTRFRSEDELYKKQLLTIAAEETNLISSPKKIMESSHIGDIENSLDRASEGLGSILKFNKPEFREILEKVIYEYAKNKYLGKEKFTKVAEKLIASFLDYVIQVKRPFDIKNLVVDADSVANRIDQMRPKHPEVKILKDLVLVSSDTPGGAKTVKLRVNTKDSYDEDLYVGYMREMRDNPATRDLYEDLIRLAIIQGTYYSSVSIKNIVPSEDYARVVAPIMTNLTVDSDIKAFAKNKMFQRNLFKDENVVARVHPKFDESDDLIGFDENDVEIYQYSTKAFPIIPQLGLDQNQRTIFKLKPFAKGGTHSVITIPRLVNVGESLVDFITGRTVTRAHYSARKTKGDRTIYDVYGYKRVEEEDGTPFLTEDGYYIYKQINLLGDGQLATEHSVYPRKSVINNNTVKIETEISDIDIIRYFVTDSVNVSQTEEQEEEVIAFNVDNMRKIIEGKKTSTLRVDREASDIGIPVGQTQKIKIAGKEFNVTNRGKMNINQAGGKTAMAKSEGLSTTPDENNKYIIEADGVKYYAASIQTQSWFNGTGSDLFVYNIQPVSPAEQAPPTPPTPTAPTEETTSAKQMKTVEKISTPISVDSVKEIGRYVKYKDGTYIVTKINDNGTIQIYNPTLEGPSAKLSVSEKNLSPIDNKAVIVEYKGAEYIVTPKKTIISLATNKIMKWGETDGNRKDILQLVEKKLKEDFGTITEFTEEQKKTILSNFAAKHKMTEEAAKAYINDALAKDKNNVLKILKECY